MRHDENNRDNQKSDESGKKQPGQGAGSQIYSEGGKTERKQDTPEVNQDQDNPGRKGPGQQR